MIKQETIFQKVILNLIPILLMISLIKLIPDDYMLSIAYIILITMFFYFHYEKNEIKIYLLGLIIMAFIEHIFVSTGVETFSRRSLFGTIPLWIPILWGYGFVAIKRVTMTLHLEASTKTSAKIIKKNKTNRKGQIDKIFIYAAGLFIAVAFLIVGYKILAMLAGVQSDTQFNNFKSNLMSELNVVAKNYGSEKKITLKLPGSSYDSIIFVDFENFSGNSNDYCTSMPHEILRQECLSYHQSPDGKYNNIFLSDSADLTQNPNLYPVGFYYNVLFYDSHNVRQKYVSTSGSNAIVTLTLTNDGQNVIIS